MSFLHVTVNKQKKGLMMTLEAILGFTFVHFRGKMFQRDVLKFWIHD